jgi:RHS repeat-associated protein
MNRLAGVTTGQMTTPLDYDAAGNLTREGTTRFLEWDHANRMRTFRTQVNQDEPTTWMQCLYDAQGHRVMKIVRNRGAAVEITVYIGAMFERHTADVGAAAVAYDMIHVLDDKRRVAQRRVGTPFAGDTAPVTTYHYDDHLGSAVLITDAQGSWLNREEQYPLGGTSFGGFARKKYRFLGKELDHNGFYCIGARYYAPHLGRWSSCDPSGLSGGINVYQYAGANPIRLVDHSGRSPTAADVADAWEQAGTWPSLPGERSLSGEQISAGISTWMYDVNTAFLEALPEGQGFFPSLVRQWGALQSTSLQSAVDVVGGIAGCVADPGSIVRGVMRIGNASAQGVEEIRGGNTTVGLAHIGGDVGNALLITAGALRVGGRIAQMPKVPPLSKLFDGHVPKQGFSGVFDPKTGKAQMRPSFDPDFNTGPKPSDWVNRRRGHLEVSTEMGRDVHHQAFTVKLEANGTLSVDWYSGSVNTQNPLFGGSAIVPEQFRPAIIKAIEAATGRTVN